MEISPAVAAVVLAVPAAPEYSCTSLGNISFLDELLVLFCCWPA